MLTPNMFSQFFSKLYLKSKGMNIIFYCYLYYFIVSCIYLSLRSKVECLDKHKLP